MLSLLSRRHAMTQTQKGTGLFAATLLLLAVAAMAADPGYKVVQKVTLGGEGGWDYLTMDPTAPRLFVTHGTHVVVVDTESNKAVGEIPDTPGVHGVTVAPDLGRGFTSNGRENTVSVFDLKTLKVLSKVKTGENPDAIIYDPASHRVFAFDGRSNDATVIDGAAGTVVKTIPLGGKPEFAAVDGAGQVFVNIEDKAEIAAIDAKSLEVKARWALKPCEEPSGLAFDPKEQRLYAACGNKQMAVVDAKTGKLLASPPIGGGVDGAAFDPERRLAFSSNGEGSLTVIGEPAPGKFEVVATVPTERGARTIALDPKTHAIYTVTAQFGPMPSAAPGAPRQRPPIVPGSFELLVVKP
jgi:YVTN family beta-propeller protein